MIISFSDPMDPVIGGTCGVVISGPFLLQCFKKQRTGRGTLIGTIFGMIGMVGYGEYAKTVRISLLGNNPNKETSIFRSD